jgi:hypothetical protein
MDRWAWSHLEPWLQLPTSLPVGRLFCVVRGPTRGRPCGPAGIREQLHHAALAAGVRRRFAPHHYADLAIRSRYLRGIDNTEIIQAVHQRPEPMIPAGRQLLPDR